MFPDLWKFLNSFILEKRCRTCSFNTLELFIARLTSRYFKSLLEQVSPKNLKRFQNKCRPFYERPTANTRVKTDSNQWSLDSNDRSCLQLIAENRFFPFVFDVRQSTETVKIWPEMTSAFLKINRSNKQLIHFVFRSLTYVTDGLSLPSQCWEVWIECFARLRLKEICLCLDKTHAYDSTTEHMEWFFVLTNIIC